MESLWGNLLLSGIKNHWYVVEDLICRQQLTQFGDLFICFGGGLEWNKKHKKFYLCLFIFLIYFFVCLYFRERV